MINKYFDFLKEEYLQDIFRSSSGTDYKVYQLLYYAFDWDDNILKMPTEIILLDDQGLEIGMSTQDFAEFRDIIGKQTFSYQGKKIVGYAKDSFRYFRDEMDEDIFKKDVEKAIKNKLFAKSYDDFIECLITGSIFAIITARGHESAPMRKGIEFIINNLTTQQKTSMINHLKMFAHLFDEPMKSDETLIKEYLDKCEYIGVSSPSRGGKPDNPEKAKEEAFLNFVEKCNTYAKELEIKFNNEPETIKKGEKWRVIAKIGFSDDDAKNIKHMDDVVRELKNETYSNVKEFYMKDTGKQELKTNIYTKYEERVNVNKFIREFDNFLKKKTNSLTETSHQTPGLESSVLKFTQFGNMAAHLNPIGPDQRQDDGANAFKRATKYLSGMSKEVLKPKKIKRLKKKKKSSE